MADSKREEKNRIAEREREVRNKITAAFLNVSDNKAYPTTSQDRRKADLLENDIRKRMKELQCLYTISSITQNLNSPIGEVIKEIADSIPSGMQYPEQAYVKIITYGNEYRTDNYSNTRWNISADIRERDIIVGTIEIGYLTIKPTSYYMPFLDEEKKLLTAIADLTGIHFERRHSQQMFENLASNSPISIYIAQEGKFKYINPDFVKSSGFSEDELLAMNIYELVIPEDRQSARVEALDMIKGKRSAPYEFRVVNKDGSIRHVLESITSIQYNEQRATLGSHIDITELKQAEESLRESEEFSTSLLENAPYQINVINPDMSIKYVNPAFEEANGWTLEELIGMKPPFPWWPQEGKEESLTRFKAAIERGSGKAETLVIRKDGSSYTLELYWAPIKHDGDIAFIVINAIDVTERKKAEEELLLRAQLLDNASDAIVVNDIEGNILYVNESFCRSVNLTRDELIGEILDNINMPNSELSLEQRFREIEEKGDEIFEVSRVESDGSVSTTEVHSLIIESGDKKLMFNAGRDITERKKVEEELVLRAQLLDNVGDSISVFDEQRNLVYANERFCKSVGYTWDELIGMNVDQLNMPRSDLPSEERLKMLQEKGEVVFEAVQHHEDGSVDSIEVHALVIESGGMKLFINAGRDINERKQAETALQEERDKAQTYLDIIGVILVAIDSLGNVSLINKKGCEVLGYTEEEIIGKNWFEYFIPPRIQDELFEVSEKILSEMTDASYYYENPVLTRNGEERLIAWKNTIIKDEAGNVTGHLSSGEDITERKKAEELLKENEAFRSRLLSNSPTPILVVNPDTSVRYINPAFEELTGFSASEIIGTKAPYPWWRQKVTDEAIQKIKDTMEQEQDMMEVLFQKKNGKKFWVETTSTPVFVDGKLQYALLSWNDITERKQVEKSLIESEEKYRSLINNVHLGVFRSTPGPTGKFLEVNPAMTIITGYSREELLQMDVSSLYLHPKQRAEILSTQTTGPMANELFLKKKDGTVINVLDIKVAVGDDTGNILYYDGILEDITERKEMEERIQQDYSMQSVRNELLRVSMEDLSLEEILDRSLSLILSIPWLSFESTGSIFIVEDEPDVLVMKAQKKLPEPVRQACTRIKFGKCVCGLAAFTKEIQLADHTNPEYGVLYESLNPHSHYCIPILYANRVLGVINMYVKEGHQPNSRDEEFLSAVANALAGIIERKHNENELRQSEERLRVMFESLSEGIMVYDKHGNILRINDTILEMHGYGNKEELIGKSLFDLITERERSRVKDNLKATINAGHSENVQYTFIRKDGSEFPGELSSTALLDDSGNLTGFVAISIDITNRIRSNEQLIVTDRLAAIGELSSGIAHEINNPLTGIIGFSDLLMEREIPEDIRADLEIINREARRTADIVKKLLTFARRHPEKKDFIDLNKIINEVVEMRDYEQKVNNIEVETNYSDSLPEVIADGFELQQVFINLVVNAEHFMIEKNGRGTLAITTELADNCVRASFADNGPGIQPENLKHVFDPFFTTKEVGKGTGLGLSICHGIITKYNGRIYAESEPGKGATFIVELPVPDIDDKEAVK